MVPLQLFQLGDLARERVGVEFLNYIILHVSDFFLVRLLCWIVGAGNEREEFRVWNLGFDGFYFVGFIEVGNFVSQ